MLTYFLIIWIIIFILLYLYFFFNKGPKDDKQHFLGKIIFGGFLSGGLLLIYYLFFISLSFVILFDLNYKFGNIGFIFGLLIFIPIYFLYWKNRKYIDSLALKYIYSFLKMSTPNEKHIKENFISNYESKNILILLFTLLIAMGFFFIISKYIFQFSSKSALVISFILGLLSPIFFFIYILLLLIKTK